jgi:hypothetical protein
MVRNFQTPERPLARPGRIAVNSTGRFRAPWERAYNE